MKKRARLEAEERKPRRGRRAYVAPQVSEEEIFERGALLAASCTKDRVTTPGCKLGSFT